VSFSFIADNNINAVTGRPLVGSSLQHHHAATNLIRHHFRPSNSKAAQQILTRSVISAAERAVEIDEDNEDYDYSDALTDDDIMLDAISRQSSGVLSYLTGFLKDLLDY